MSEMNPVFNVIFFLQDDTFCSRLILFRAVVSREDSCDVWLLLSRGIVALTGGGFQALGEALCVAVVSLVKL